MADELIDAIRGGKLAAARAAVKAGPEAARQPKYMVAAGRLGSLPIIQLLHRNGSDLNNLICWGQIPQTMWLLAHNASPNIADTENGWTAVHQAASRGNARIMRAVLDAGGDLGRRDKQGRTPIDVARSVGRDKLLALMSAAAR